MTNNNLYVPLSEVEKMYNNPSYDIDDLPRIDLWKINTMIETHEKRYRNTTSYSEDGNGWIRWYKNALQELKSSLLLTQK